MSLEERVITGGLSALLTSLAGFAGYGIDLSLTEAFRHAVSTGNILLGASSTLACIGVGAIAAVGAVHMGQQTIEPR